MMMMRMRAELNRAIRRILNGSFLCISSKIRVANLTSHRALEKLYIFMEVYNSVFSKWLKFMVAPTLFAISCGMIVVFYVTLRHTELPILLYVVFPYAGLTMLVILFWISYDATVVIQASEKLLSQLRSDGSQYLAGLSREEKIRILLRSRAMRPLAFPIGNFTNFSLAVPANIWDEVLNQIVFLLSL